jgi:glycosyltransferase involved in cell wall biosynthesis
MKLSIVIPVYNESGTILEIVDKIQSVLLDGIDKELIIIDDFSTDGTRDIIKNFELMKDIKVLYHTKNSGKGAALKSGFSQVTGDFVIIQDADLEYDPQDYHRLLQPLLDNKADVVYGSRFVGAEPHRVLFFWHSIGNKFLTLFSNMMTNLNLTDMETCYKAFNAKILKLITIEEKRFGFEPEFTAKIAKQKLRVFEVGISYYGRTYAEGKKINWKDGVVAIWCIFKYNLFTKKTA